MTKHIIIGLMLLTISFYGIRTQFLITPNQYIKTMIPHNSMAITMGKELLNNQQSNSQLSNSQLSILVNNIITNQQDEINLMKNLEK